MMKYCLIMAMLVIVNFSLKAQNPAPYIGAKIMFNFPAGCGTPAPIDPVYARTKLPALYYDTCASQTWVWNPKIGAWKRDGADSSLYATRHRVDSLFGTIEDTIAIVPAGTAISSLPAIGYNPGTNKTGDWIKSVFYQTQPPTAALSGGSTRERSNSDYTHNLSATIGRQAATATIGSAVITAPSQSYPLTFSQPAQPGTVPVTQSVTTPANVNTTYTLTVSTTDSPTPKTATASTTDSWASYRYWGFISDTTNLRAGTGGIDATLGALTKELTDARAKGGTPEWNTGSPTGNQYFVYLYWGASGELTRFDFNGVPSLDGMNKVKRNFTAPNGYTGEFWIFWTKNLQSTSSVLITQ